MILHRPPSPLTYTSPRVTSTGLTIDKVVRTEKFTIRTGADGIHGSWFKINKDSSVDKNKSQYSIPPSCLVFYLPWHVLTGRAFIVVNIDAFQLEIIITAVSTSGIQTMFLTDGFPELLTNL
jgi:hypothetical protein